jgi:hypothetical protein
MPLVRWRVSHCSKLWYILFAMASFYPLTLLIEPSHHDVYMKFFFLDFVGAEFLHI